MESLVGRRVKDRVTEFRGVVTDFVRCQTDTILYEVSALTHNTAGFSDPVWCHPERLEVQRIDRGRPY
jgi:hypothetical protein